MDAKQLAVMFHNEYEKLAPSFGYETREETRTFDAESGNGKLMIAVCQRIIEALPSPNSDITKCPNGRKCFPTLDRALRNIA